MSVDTLQFMNLHQLEANPKEGWTENAGVIYFNDDDIVGRLRQPKRDGDLQLSQAFFPPTLSKDAAVLS